MKKYIKNKLFNVLRDKKVFIFDFDETIASTQNILFETLKTLGKKHGVHYTKKLFSEVKGKPGSEYFAQFKSLVKTELDEKETLKDYLNIFNEKMKNEKLECFPYVKEIIKQFPNKVYCVASNNVLEFLEQRLSEFGIRDCFKHIFACGDGLITKQYVYENINFLVDAKPSECVLFEDGQKYIESAKSYGFLTVGILHDENKDLKADFIIDLREDK